MRVLLLDNYDSFTYNLYHYLDATGVDVKVRRNDEISVADAVMFDAIVLSPGPGLPKDAGILMKLLEAMPDHLPVLGVCLGLQAIVQRFGGTLKNLETVIHGQSTWCTIVDEDTIFHGIDSPFEVGHYHSWAADEWGSELIITSRNEHDIVMSVRHRTRPIKAVQFHPESVLTPMGKRMIENWIKEVKSIQKNVTYENHY